MNIEKKEIWDFSFFIVFFYLFIYLFKLSLFFYTYQSFFSDHQVSVNQCQLLGKHGKF